MINEQYYIEYKDFLKKYDQGMVGPEEIGKMVARFAQFYAEYNVAYVDRVKELSKLTRINEAKEDGNGKSISSTKAKALTEDSETYYGYCLMKAHVDNLSNMIDGLKQMQYGVSKEWTAMKNS